MVVIASVMTFVYTCSVGRSESGSSVGCWSAVYAAENFAGVPANGRQVSLRV